MNSESNPSQSQSMNISQNQQNYVTAIISTVVKPEFMTEYEQWVEKINTAASQAAGFFSVDVIKPKDHTQPEYIVIIKFDNFHNQKEWLNSVICKNLIAEAQNFILHRSKAEIGNGMEIWFSRADTQRYYPKPKYYKQVLMGLMVVYPLSTVIGMLIAPYISTFSPYLQTFIIISIMSCLMTWPVMPYLSLLLNNWLYPKPQ